MSDNYKLYARKMAEQRAGRSRPLQLQLDELLEFVSVCETRWARQDWTERRS